MQQFNVYLAAVSSSRLVPLLIGHLRVRVQVDRMAGRPLLLLPLLLSLVPSGEQHRTRVSGRMAGLISAVLVVGMRVKISRRQVDFWLMFLLCYYRTCAVNAKSEQRCR